MNHFQWEKEVPIYANRFFLKGLAGSVGLPLILLIILVSVTNSGNVFGNDARYAYGLFVISFILVSFLLLLVYKGKYAPGFIVDEEGIINYIQLKYKKHGKLYNFLSLISELFSRNYKAPGTLFSVQYRQVSKIKWENVRKIKLYPNQNTVLIKSDFTDKIAVFCTKDNYEDVSHMIYKMSSRQKRRKYS